jgi:hypothetical protein
MYIILLDFDGTIIGDISELAKEHYIFTQLENKKVQKSSCIENFIRPGLSEFVHTLKKSAEIFIYTASQKDWAEHAIRSIERSIEFNFQRPLLTRNYTLYEGSSYSKKLSLVQKTLSRVLSKKGYPKDVVYSSIFIDNSPNMILDKEKVIPIPTYSYKEPTDILRNVSKETIRKNMQAICSLCNINETTNEDEFYMRYYYALAMKYKKKKQDIRTDSVLNTMTLLLEEYRKKRGDVSNNAPNIVQKLHKLGYI